MQSKTDIAVSKFMDGYNCAQSVFYAFCDDLGFDKNTALKLACGFGAGMGKKEEVCGAVTGGILVIGAKYGRGETGDGTFTETTYQKTRDLMDRFSEEHGSFICRRLLQECDLMTEEGRNQVKERDFRNKICTPCVRSAAEILESIL